MVDVGKYTVPPIDVVGHIIISMYQKRQKQHQIWFRPR